LNQSRKMNVEDTVKKIKKLHNAITNKSDSIVELSYLGTGNGITMPWRARIDAREINAASHDDALSSLLDILRVELQKKIEQARASTTVLEATLNEVRGS
jgi:hypothetical protein